MTSPHQRGSNDLPIQPSWPLRMDDVYGPYAPITKIALSVQQDFKFLLLSSPGDWPFNPDLGVGFHRYLFEPQQAFAASEINRRISSQVSKYLPAVEIINIESAQDEIFQNKIKISIEYAIPQLCLKNRIVLNLGEDIEIEEGSCTSFVEAEPPRSHVIEVPTEL